MSSTAAAVEDPTDGLTSSHKLKLKPPTFDGTYNNFEEWPYKFTAYMGLQDAFYPNRQHNRSQNNTYAQQPRHWKRLTTGYNSTPTSSTSSSM